MFLWFVKRSGLRCVAKPGEGIDYAGNADRAFTKRTFLMCHFHAPSTTSRDCQTSIRGQSTLRPGLHPRIIRATMVSTRNSIAVDSAKTTPVKKERTRPAKITKHGERSTPGKAADLDAKLKSKRAKRRSRVAARIKDKGLTRRAAAAAKTKNRTIEEAEAKVDES